MHTIWPVVCFSLSEVGLQGLVKMCHNYAEMGLGNDVVVGKYEYDSRTRTSRLETSGGGTCFPKEIRWWLRCDR